MLDEANIMDLMARLSDSYIVNKDTINMEKIDQQIEKIKAEHNEM